MFNSVEKNTRLAAAFGSFIFSASQILLLTLYPVWAEALNLSLPTLIAVFASGSLCFLFGAPYWAHHSDRYGRKNVLMMGLVALALSQVILLLLTFGLFTSTSLNFALLLGSRILYGLVASAITPLAQAIQADWSGPDQSIKAMTLHSISLSFGRVVGAAGAVIFYASYQQILIILILITCMVFLACALLIKDHNASKDDKLEQTSWRQEIVAIKWIAAMALVFTCFMEALNSSLGGTVQQLLGLNSVNASGLTAKILLAASVGVLLMQILTRLFFHKSLRLGLAVGCFSLLFGAIMLIYAQSVALLWFAISLIVVGLGILPPLYLSLLKSLGKRAHYGRRAGLIGSVHTLGYALGGFIAAFSLRFNAEIGFSLICIALLLAWICSQQMRASRSEFV